MGRFDTPGTYFPALPRPGGRPYSAASGLYIALVIQIPAVTALTPSAHLPPRRSTRSPLEVVRVLSHPKHRVAATKADLKAILSDHIRCFALTMVCGMFVRQKGIAPWNLQQLRAL